MEDTSHSEPSSPRSETGSRYYTIKVGSTLGRGFTIWLKNIVPFSLLSLLISLPLVAIPFAVPLEEWAQGLLDALFTVIGGAVLGGMLASTVFQQLRGRATSLGDTVSVGVSRLFPVLGTGLLAGICVWLGTLACIIPGLILQCALFVAVPACVVEKPGVMGSLNRSFSLTKGSRWPIFGVSFVAGIFATLCAFVLGMAIAGLGADERTINALSSALGLVMAVPNSVMQAVVYHDLRLGKEGVGVDELVEVFA